MEEGSLLACASEAPNRFRVFLFVVLKCVQCTHSLLHTQLFALLSSQVEAHYRNTLAHIKGMQAAEATKEKFAAIVLFPEGKA